jgi:predicted nucleic acid-binding protein
MLLDHHNARSQLLCQRVNGHAITIIDERRGRRIAQQVFGLSVKGTAGILVEAQRRGLISGVRPRLLELRAAGYFIADSVIVAACKAAGE